MSSPQMKSPTTEEAKVTSELAHQSTGALRVARRQSLYAFKQATKAKNRLNIGMFDEDDFHPTDYNALNSITSSERLAEEIEQELERRGAEYKSREEVLN